MATACLPLDESGGFVRDERGRNSSPTEGSPSGSGATRSNRRRHLGRNRGGRRDSRHHLRPQTPAHRARIVMLQRHARAHGLKVYGPDLETIESFGLELERPAQTSPECSARGRLRRPCRGQALPGNRHRPREAIARYGIKIGQVQRVIEVAIGGKPLTMTVEGRSATPSACATSASCEIRPRQSGHARPAPSGHPGPAPGAGGHRYRRGPQMIKSEDTFLVAYVLFDKRPGEAEVDVVNEARALIKRRSSPGTWRFPRA